MTVSLSSPVTGSPQTGLTSPTYTLTTDTSPDPTAKQWVISALGGTQTGVVPHSISNPFWTSIWKPKTYAQVSIPNPVTGAIGVQRLNRHKLITQKGLIPLAGQPSQPGTIHTNISVPAGADTADPSSIRAMISAHIGSLQQISAGLGDTVVTGVL